MTAVTVFGLFVFFLVVHLVEYENANGSIVFNLDFVFPIDGHGLDKETTPIPYIHIGQKWERRRDGEKYKKETTTIKNEYRDMDVKSNSK